MEDDRAEDATTVVAATVVVVWLEEVVVAAWRIYYGVNYQMKTVEWEHIVITSTSWGPKLLIPLALAARPKAARVRRCLICILRKASRMANLMLILFSRMYLLD